MSTNEDIRAAWKRLEREAAISARTKAAIVAALALVSFSMFCGLGYVLARVLRAGWGTP